MSSTIKKIWKRENVLIIVLIIVALLGVIDVPQKIGLTTLTSDKILLALLGALALDTLIERLGYLDRIETRIGNLESKIESQASADNLLRPREQMPSFESSLQQGEEIWMAGRSLAGLLDDYATKIQQAAAHGKRFRFLMVNPDNSPLMNALSDTNSSYPHAVTTEQEIRDAVVRANLIAENSPKGNVEIRLMDYIPPNAYRIVDGRKPNGQMVVEQFGYKISTSERLHIYLTRTADNRSFTFYLEQFDKMWLDAKPVSRGLLRRTT